MAKTKSTLTLKELEATDPFQARRSLRYWAYRWKNDLENGKKPTGGPRGLRAKLEGLDGFNGWEQFAEGKPSGWDFVYIADRESDEDVWIFEARDIGYLKEWERELAKHVPILPEMIE